VRIGLRQAVEPGQFLVGARGVEVGKVVGDQPAIREVQRGRVLLLGGGDEHQRGAVVIDHALLAFGEVDRGRAGHGQVVDELEDGAAVAMDAALRPRTPSTTPSEGSSDEPPGGRDPTATVVSD